MTLQITNMCEPETKIGGKFVLGKRIGGGAFGEVFSGANCETMKPVAIKREVVDKKHGQLTYEARIYKLLQGNPGIPKFYGYFETSDYNYLVLELLGPSLESLRKHCGNNFSESTMTVLMDQMLARIELFHTNNFLHRDIKPENFTIGTEENSGTVFIIDYGLTKRFRDPRTSAHIPFRDNKKLAGTARYASLNTHLGAEQSRRDDLECLAYSALYLIKGSLPWQGISVGTKQDKYKFIKDMKANTGLDILCKGIPREFFKFFYYIRSLKFEEKPNYSELRKLFKDLYYRNKYESNFKFDWEIKGINISHIRDGNLDAAETNIAECPGRRQIEGKSNDIGITEISEPKKEQVDNPFFSRPSFALQCTRAKSSVLHKSDLSQEVESPIQINKKKVIVFYENSPEEDQKSNNNFLECEGPGLKKMFTLQDNNSVNVQENENQEELKCDEDIPEERKIEEIPLIPLPIYINDLSNKNCKSPCTSFTGTWKRHLLGCNPKEEEDYMRTLSLIFRSHSSHYS